MKLKINTKVFTLNEIYPKLDYGKTVYFLNNLSEVREELKNDLAYAESCSDDDVVTQLKFQLKCIDQNIKTFKNALSLHELEVTYQVTLFGQVTDICLN